jgi:hypothetical protein
LSYTRTSGQLSSRWLSHHILDFGFDCLKKRAYKRGKGILIDRGIQEAVYNAQNYGHQGSILGGLFLIVLL